MQNLREKTNTGSQREREVKYGSFLAKMGDLTGMFYAEGETLHLNS